MSVYVDGLKEHPMARAACFRAGACHMVADTEAELHAMASSIGLKRRYCQERPMHLVQHYDLTASRRKLAVQNGAIEITRDELFARFINPALRKEHGPCLPSLQ